MTAEERIARQLARRRERFEVIVEPYKGDGGVEGERELLVSYSGGNTWQSVRFLPEERARIIKALGGVVKVSEPEE